MDNRRDEQDEQVNFFPRIAPAPGSKRLSLAHAASPRLARSHARTNETKRFPGWGHKGLTPPTSDIYVYASFSFAWASTLSTHRGLLSRSLAAPSEARFGKGDQGEESCSLGSGDTATHNLPNLRR